MGDWNATCAASRTAIQGDDAVLAIWTDEDWIRDTSTVQSWAHWQRRYAKKYEKDAAMWERILKAAALAAEDFGALGGPEPSDKVHWSWGTYDTYGGINEVPLKDRPLCLIHRAVAEKLIRLGGYEEDGEEDDPLLRLLGACYAARIQIGGNELLGIQYVDAADMWRVIKTGRIVRRWQWRMFWRVNVDEFRQLLDSAWWSGKYRLGKLLKR